MGCKEPTGVNLRNKEGDQYEVFIGALRTGHRVQGRTERRARKAAERIADTLLDQGFHIPTRENHQ